MLKNLPHNLQFDLIVSMNNDIPCTDHRRPWNCIVLFLKLAGDLIGCFSDDNKVVKDRILGFIICKKLLIAGNGICLNCFDCLYNIA